jgi:hypothetical protein
MLLWLLLATAEATALQRWVDGVGARRASESFGELVARVGMLRLGAPYGRTPEDPALPEALQLQVTDLQCVSFVEVTLAIARCVWLGRALDCVPSEVQALRYRDGHIDGYPSRLHYLSEWLAQAQRSGRVQLLPAPPDRRPLHYMTSHPHAYPHLADPRIRAAIAATEATQSGESMPVIRRSEVAAAVLQTGDVVAFVGHKPGLRITHAGFVVHGAVLHASSHHGRVLVTRGSVADYVWRRPERQGVIVARPAVPLVQ